jgi:hypothetical protein
MSSSTIRLHLNSKTGDRGQTTEATFPSSVRDISGFPATLMVSYT